MAVFLPWVSGALGGGNGFDVPVSALWDIQGGGGGLKIGVVLLVIAAVGAGLTFLPGTGPIRRILGGLSVLISVVFLVQLYRVVNRFGGSAGDYFDALGIAPFVSLGGGGLLAASK